MKLIFIRHLPTPGNEKRQYIGRTDEEVSPRALEEFYRNREIIRKGRKAGDLDPGSFYPAQYIIASPLKRCVQTGELIYPGQEIYTDPRLRECDFGEYEQKTYEELKNELAYIRWMESGGKIPFPGGEDPDAFRIRCVQGVEKWIDRLVGEGVGSAAFVVHGGTIMAALSHMADERREFYHWQVKNGEGYQAEVREEEWKGGRKVLRKIRRVSLWKENLSAENEGISAGERTAGREEGGKRMERCPWCMCNEKMIRYHDEEWGVPVYDDQKQFEFLMMEVMQCGLNWNMMIQKREIFRKCFDDFDFDKVAAYNDEDVRRILNTEGMIRSERKIRAVIHNAGCFQKIRREEGSFASYLWSFTKGKTYLYAGHQKGMMPARNGLSDRISRELKKKGMKYMGSITVYSHLQACGIINDHLESCFRYEELQKITDAVRKRRDGE